MGVLTSGERLVVLGPRTEVGRDKGCGLRIEDRSISSRHARLVWDGEGWSVRDLGSTNGTQLDDERLAPGSYVPLRVGARLVFGTDHAWTFTDDGPPDALARSASGNLRVAEGGLLALPDEDHPEAVLLERDPGQWIIEEGEEPRSIQDGDSVQAGGEAWTIFLPLPYERTWRPPAAGDIAQVGLRLEFSRDEEFVQLNWLQGDAVTPIPTRTHHYMLLTLARARAEDIRQGLAKSEAGWLYSEDLRRMLRLDETGLNVQVHRARRQLGKEIIPGGIIERRPSTHQLRITVEWLEISPLN